MGGVPIILFVTASLRLAISSNEKSAMDPSDDWLLSVGMITITWAWIESTLVACLYAVQESSCGFDLRLKDGSPPRTAGKIIEVLGQAISAVAAEKPYEKEGALLLSECATISIRRNEVVHRTAVYLSAPEASVHFYKVVKGRYEFAHATVQLRDLLQLNIELDALSVRVADFGERFCKTLLIGPEPSPVN